MLQEFSVPTGYYTPQDLQNLFGITLTMQARLRMRTHQLNDKVPLKFIRVGKRILYFASDIEEFFKAKRDEVCLRK